MLNDVNRRKRNVIVSGLAECDNTTGNGDAATFQQLCMDYLQCKPFVVTCQRIGKQTPDKPRRLFVRLKDESTASEILRMSRLLRSADDTVVAESVFINPDLTVAAAKLAYEERQKRRQQKLVNSSTNSNRRSNGTRTVYRSHNNEVHATMELPTNMLSSTNTDSTDAQNIDISDESSTAFDNHKVSVLSTGACLDDDHTRATGNLTTDTATVCHIDNNNPSPQLRPDAPPFRTE